MGLLDGKVALITGAARGIGKAIALRFAAEGADIAFTDLAVNEETAAEIAAYGRKARSYASNAADFAATQAVVDEILKDFGRIDILVNNAGITRDGLVMRMSEEQWDAVIDVNMKSAFNFLHAVVPVMARQRSGSIIHMASIAGQTGNPGQVNYAASKAGIIGFSKSCAKEFAARNIRVNIVCPGFIETEMTAEVPTELMNTWCSRIPMKRPGTADEVAQACLFLASDMCPYITSVVLPICGGMEDA
jgi:3-oxoacyl-[acyl-carrier protein] reductase